jgi:hypothetical protein
LYAAHDPSGWMALSLPLAGQMRSRIFRQCPFCLRLLQVEHDWISSVPLKVVGIDLYVNTR